MRSPNDFRDLKLRTVESRSRIKALSVISIIRFAGSKPVSRSDRLTLSRIELWASSRADRFTLTSDCDEAIP